MTIAAKVIAHSSFPGAPDLITLQLRYPRFIHAEAKTHRVINIDDAEYELLQEISFMDDENLSRNASSSRAVPIERMIQDVIDDPAMPVAWGSNKPGMQAGDELPHWEIARECWLDARDAAVERAKEMMNLGAHKQIVNRLLEPFAHIAVVCTATEWSNFFDLRIHPAADPTMRALAVAMKEAIDASTPRMLTEGEWHVPYVSDHERAHVPVNVLLQLSAARCARVSYLNHDQSAPTIPKDIALADSLLTMRHLSPFEHAAQASSTKVAISNLHRWHQNRKVVE